MADDSKRVNCVKVCFNDREFIDLGRMAARDDRAAAEWVRMIVRRHMYGNLAASIPPDEGTERDRDGP